MKKKIGLLFTGLSLAISCVYSQTDIDALRYSQTSISGTARYTSMGGAFGAVGGDFSCLANNPAGIAIYRSSEASFTPSIYVGSTNSRFINNSLSDNRFNFNFGNAGLVYTTKLSNNDESEGWKSWNFGFGYNRVDNYHNKSFYEGLNPDNSFTNYLAEQSQGLDYSNLNSFYEYLAYMTYLTNPDSSNHYSAAVANGNVTQRRSAESRGSKGETDFSFGGNYSNRLYVGATLGFSSLRYIEDVTYEEVDKNQPFDSLTNFSFDQSLTTHGYGFNFKVGMIYRPADWIRVGAAIHTPTWYSMHDEYVNIMKSKFAMGSTYKSESPAGAFDYNLTTPFKAIGSVALLFEKSGLLSADYEITDISQARIDASGTSFFDVNDEIRKKYSTISTVRVGAEWRIGNYSLRGGTAFTTSPITSAYKVSGYDYSKTSYSGGIGIRDKDVFVDIGYVFSQSNQFFQPYTLNNDVYVPGARNTVNTHNFTLTFGVKF